MGGAGILVAICPFRTGRTRMRRRLVLLVSLALAAAGIAFAPAPAEAAGFCGPSEGCSPCPFEVVIDGKNTHIQWYYC